MSKRKAALIRALPILIGIIIFGAIIVALALRTAQSVNRSRSLAARFDDLAAACRGQDIPQAAPFREANTLHPAVGFRQRGGEWVLDPAAVPRSWQPDSVARAQLVLCLEEAQLLGVPRCTPDETGALPTRVYGQSLEARLITPADGQVFAADTLRSAPDPGCWSAGNEPQAPSVSTDQLRDWLEEYVTEE